MLQTTTELGWQFTWGTVVWLIANLMAVATVPSVLYHRKGQPLSSLAWLFALIGLPVVGVFAWWTIGRLRMQRIKRRRVNARNVMSRHISALGARLPDVPLRSMGALATAPSLSDDELGQIFPVTRDNQVELLVDAAEAYPVMITAIEAARHHIHLQFYIWEADATGRHFRDLLVTKAKAGVEVRVLIDAVGGSAVNDSFMEPLKAAGAAIAFFLPARIFSWQNTINFRNHRKIIVIDGQTGFIGGLNIGDGYTRDWHDLAVRLDGPVVDQLQEVFADDWFFANGENLADPAYFGGTTPQTPEALRDRARCHVARCRIMASGPDTRQNATHDALFIGITGAKRRLWLTTPYFIPDTAIQVALRTAAYKGVDVRLMLPHRSDVPFVRLAGRSYYGDLLAAGIRIFEYDGAILHAKSVLIDDKLSVVGSANLDIRSLQLNFEANCIINSQAINASLAALFEKDLVRSVEIRPEDLQNRRFGAEFLETVAHLLSPLL
ncbi:MAG: cardiolipin synthase [Candidatus Sericytochromatia bacterium]|nr:cardiolipin synthase [Candidatus Sericytochromatia bacterium]